jgi:hypothetical protein
MLEALAKWTKWRLWWTLGLGYVLSVEFATLLASRIPPCVVEGEIYSQADGTKNEYCPAFHSVLFSFFGFLEDHSEAVTAVATLAIAVFTWTLWQSSEKMWGATKIAAEAAQKSADVIPAIERPYVFIKEMIAEVPAGQYAPPSHLLPRYGTVEASFFNYGRTPANVAEVAIFVRILDHLPTGADETHILANADTRSTIEVIIGPDKEWSLPSARCIEPISEFGVGKALYCWGYLKYRDIFGKVHPTYFCRQFDGKVMVPVGGFERNKSA